MYSVQHFPDHIPDLITNFAMKCNDFGVIWIIRLRHKLNFPIFALLH